MSQTIEHLQVRGEIADGWKKIRAGFAKLDQVVTDLLDPQGDLFPIDPAEFHDDFKEVYTNARRLLEQYRGKTVPDVAAK